MAVPLEARQSHHREQRADVQTRGRRIEADVRSDLFCGQRVGQPVRDFGDEAAPAQVVQESCHAGNGLLYQSMAVTRRDVLKALATAGIGAATGAGSYGYLYERHRLEITRADLPVTGLPSELSGLRIGMITDV